MSRRRTFVAWLRRRCQGDRGGALVETAILTPVFLLLVFGIIEFGVIYRDYLTVGDAVAGGARFGGIWGPETKNLTFDGDGDPTTTGDEVQVPVNGDLATMKAVRENMVAVPIEWIERIVIFRAARPGSTSGSAVDQVPAACRYGAVPGNGPGCNVYDPRDAFLQLEGTIGTAEQNYFRCLGGSEPACGWDPDDRDNADSGIDGDEIEYLGVYIKVDRPYLTGIFGDTFTMEQAYVLRLESGALGATG